MHAHGEPGRDQRETREAPRAALPAEAAASAVSRPGDLSPAMLLALQRSVGNAAVVGTIGDARDGAAPADAVHDVLRSPGQPLGESVRSEMEARLGAGFSDVRLHTGPAALRSAAELGARAYTSGNHVVVGEGGADPHTLAHELTHVVQQRRGPVAGTDTGTGLSVSDPSDRFEREAEATAARAMTGQPGASQLAASASDEQPEPRSTGTVQRTVTMYTQPASEPDGVDLVAAAQLAGKTADANGLFAFLIERLEAEKAETHGLAEGERDRFVQNRAAISEQLFKWAAGTPGQGSGKHPDFGRKQQDRDYGNYSDLARGLLGWVESKDHRREEKQLADEVEQNTEVELHADVLLMRVKAWIENQRSSVAPRARRRWNDIIQELTTGHMTQPGAVADDTFGVYQKYFDVEIQGKANIAGDAKVRLRTGINLNMWQVMEGPVRFSFRDKVIVLHDLMEYFGKKKRWNPRTQGENQIPDPGDPKRYLTTTDINEKGERIESDEDRGQQELKLKRESGWETEEFPSTRSESAKSTRLARKHQIPVWAGSSFTAMRMLNLAEFVEGTQDELSAVAWAIFSFWRLHYDHTDDLAYHTLHEVMDIAQNFGIPYNMLDRYQDVQRHAPGQAKANAISQLADLAATLDQASGEVERLTGELGRRRATGAARRSLPGQLAAIGSAIRDLRDQVRNLDVAVRGVGDPPTAEQRETLRRVLFELPGLDKKAEKIGDDVEACRTTIEAFDLVPGQEDVEMADAPTGDGAKRKR